MYDTKCVFSDATLCLKLVTWDEEQQHLHWIVCGGYDTECKHRTLPKEKRPEVIDTRGW